MLCVYVGNLAGAGVTIVKYGMRGFKSMVNLEKIMRDVLFCRPIWRFWNLSLLCLF